MKRKDIRQIEIEEEREECQKRKKKGEEKQGCFETNFNKKKKNSNYASYFGDFSDDPKIKFVIINTQSQILT